jgi:hypothetical protein
MKRIPKVLVLVTFACSGGADDSPMEDMTAAEHALMSSGGTQGAVDSTGASLRQPVHLSAEQ